jgi:hypothetical protein
MRGGACLAAKVISRRVDDSDRIGVADERDRLGRTRSSSETAGGVLPRSRRKNEASRPTRAPVPLPSLACFLYSGEKKLSPEADFFLQ